MDRYRSKAIIRAFQFFRECEAPPWFINLVEDVKLFSDGGVITTKRGSKLLFDEGDYIIMKGHSELERCRPGIFEVAYEKLEG